MDRRWFTASLHAWLVRRGGAVRALFVDGLVTQPASLLLCLDPQRMVSLRFRECGSVTIIALQAACALTRLTRLEASWCGVVRLPPELSELSCLRDLVLAGGPLGRLPGSFAPLSALSSLTLLDLSSCDLRALPDQLSCLLALEALNLASNDDLGEGGSEACAPLEALARLTHLSLGRCGLLGLPTQLLALTRLAELGLGENYYLSDSGEAAFDPLPASLSRLKLNHCGLERLPPQLAALSGVQELNLASNPQLGSPGALSLLSGLPRLTRLVLRSCELHLLPHALSSLPLLAELDLGHNRALGRRGGDAAFQPLAELGGSLRSLDVRSCGLRGLPAPLRALGARGVAVQWD